MTKPRLSKPLAGGLAVAAVWAGLSLGGCARSEPRRRELIVFEASSLTDAFARLAKTFEAANPGVTVVTQAAGSQQLRTQLEHGDRADVFASADRKHMDTLVAERLVAAPEIFACNEPVVVVRIGLARPIVEFADLPRAERIVVGAPEVPIGSYTLHILDKAGAKLGAEFRKRVEARIVSRELNVRQVLAKVVLGEADAGIVYRSDAVAAADKVLVVQIPRDVEVAAEYPIAATKQAPNPELARRFVELVRSPAGVAALRGAGFVPCAGR
jgi:molybdate transport system substrate-binding protein